MAVTYKLTQTELATEIAEKLGCSRADAKRFMEVAFEVVSDNLKQGYRTEIAGVVIEPKIRPAAKARMGRNPATGESIKIPARKESVAVKARVSKKLKEFAPSRSVLNSRL